MATEVALDESVDLAPAEEMIARYEQETEAVIGLLQEIQEHYGYLPRQVLDLVATRLELPPTQLYGLATFYTAFSLKPRGRHLINVCMGTTCHVKGGMRILEGLEHELGCSCGETTADGRFTFETVRCVGACALAPIIVIDEEAHGRLTPSKLKGILERYR